MKIRAGYTISYDCPRPTPMILQVSVHPTRQPDLITWDGLQIDPPIPANTYHDTFGNFCHVIRAPAGRLTLCGPCLLAGCRARRVRPRRALSAAGRFCDRGRRWIQERLGDWRRRHV